MTRKDFIAKHVSNEDDFLRDLEDLIKWELSPRPALMQKTIDLTADVLEIPRGDLKLRLRDRYLTDARFCFFRFAYEDLNVPVQTIGKFVGLHHATILYGIRQTYEVSELRKKYAKVYDYLKNNI